MAGKKGTLRLGVDANGIPYVYFEEDTSLDEPAGSAQTQQNSSGTGRNDTSVPGNRGTPPPTTNTSVPKAQTNITVRKSDPLPLRVLSSGLYVSGNADTEYRGGAWVNFTSQYDYTTSLIIPKTGGVVTFTVSTTDVVAAFGSVETRESFTGCFEVYDPGPGGLFVPMFVSFGYSYMNLTFSDPFLDGTATKISVDATNPERPEEFTPCSFIIRTTTGKTLEVFITWS